MSVLSENVMAEFPGIGSDALSETILTHKFD